MPQYLARRSFTLLGKHYRLGEAVPLEKVPEALRRKLVEQRHVTTDKVEVARPVRREGG